MNELIRSLDHHEYLYTLQNYPAGYVIGVNTELYCDLKHWKGQQLITSQGEDALKMKIQEYIFMDNFDNVVNFSVYYLNNQEISLGLNIRVNLRAIDFLNEQNFTMRLLLNFYASGYK